ncbi:MAG: hypothetical protein ACHQQQ_12550 [Bacteroidota bacterium]
MKKLIILVLLSFVVISGKVSAQYPNIPAATDPSNDLNEPVVAVSPANGNNIVLVWEQFNENYYAPLGYGIATDGGYKWKTKNLDSVQVGRNRFFKYGVDPSVAIDKNGNSYICYTALGDDEGLAGC